MSGANPSQPRILVVADADDALDAGCVDLIRALTPNYRYVSWRELRSEQNLTLAPSLTVAVASTPSDDLTQGLQQLQTTPWPTPVLTLFSPQLDDAQIALVTSVSDDFVLLPVHPVELRLRIRRMSATHDPSEQARDRLVHELATAKLVGSHPAFLSAIEQLPRFAQTDVAVLITGETGTGKELCARALHQLGPRREQPFVAVDCGAILEQLLESELFGHTKGSFTGADRDRKGLVAVAEGGTLFLDEIDALSLAAQAKLLRFLQEHTYRPVGSDRTQCANVRVIAATNRDLQRSVAEKQFRSDLYFRLNILRLHLPPLRERSTDIALLAQDLLSRASGAGATPKSFTLAALRLLTSHHWPGNVRELSNVVQRAAITSNGEWIVPNDVRLQRATDGLQTSPSPHHDGVGDFRAARAAALAHFERRYVEELLRKHGGNVTQAAREAQQDRRAFGRFIKKYQIDRTAL